MCVTDLFSTLRRHSDQLVNVLIRCLAFLIRQTKMVDRSVPSERAAWYDCFDSSPAADPLELDKEPDRAGDIMPNIGAPEARAALQHEHDQLLDRSFR